MRYWVYTENSDPTNGWLLASRLIVKLNHEIENNFVWLKGVVIHEHDCRAEIIQNITTEEGLKFIGIKVSGSNKNEMKELLRIIRREIGRDTP